MLPFFPVPCLFAAKPQKGIVRVNDRRGFRWVWRMMHRQRWFHNRIRVISQNPSFSRDICLHFRGIFVSISVGYLSPFPWDICPKRCLTVQLTLKTRHNRAHDFMTTAPLSKLLLIATYVNSRGALYCKRFDYEISIMQLHYNRTSRYQYLSSSCTKTDYSTLGQLIKQLKFNSTDRIPVHDLNWPCS